jgi:hypothetical protein
LIPAGSHGSKRVTTWAHVDIALQWQLNNGQPSGEYGALPARQTWQALVAYFF